MSDRRVKKNMKANTPRPLSIGKAILFIIIFMQIFISVGPFESKAWSANMLKMGLLEEPKTLNLWLARDRWSRRVLSLFYQPLYIRDPKTLELIPWLPADDDMPLHL